MKTKILKFRAATTEDAMEQVYRALGLDAVVLDVKQVAPRGVFSWLSSRKDVVVKASKAVVKSQLETEPDSVDVRSIVPSTVGTIAAAAAATAKSKRSQITTIDSSKRSASTLESRSNYLLKTTNSAETPEETLTAQTDGPANSDVQTTTSAASATPNSATSTSTSTSNSNRLTNSSNNVAPVPSHSISSEIWRQAAVDVVREMSHSVGSDRVVISASPDRAPSGIGPGTEKGADLYCGETNEMVVGNWKGTDRFLVPSSGIVAIEQRLDTLQQMIADLGRKPQTRGIAEIPPELFLHYLTLIEADVDDEIAHELILKLQRHAAPGQLADTAASTALLTVLIEQRIACSQSLVPKAGHRQIAIIVGPTGVGKTTTLAKLAGCHGVERGLKLGLVTVDTYRVAAVEQLRTYAEIIDLPMRVVSGSEQVQDALDSLADRDLVLIDTAGLSPHDDRRLDELKNLIDVTRPDHVYLVLSLASGAKAIRNTAARFSAVGPTSLVLTKLDEAAGCGGLLTASRDIGLPISYLTTGQDVPQDIEPANPCRAARLILGMDRLANVSPIMNSTLKTLAATNETFPRFHTRGQRSHDGPLDI